MECRNCSVTIPDDSAFCPECGTKVAESASVVSAARASDTVQETKPAEPSKDLREVETAPPDVSAQRPRQPAPVMAPMRTRRASNLLWLLIPLVVAAGVVLWWVVINDPVPPPTTLLTTTSTLEPRPTTPAQPEPTPPPEPRFDLDSWCRDVPQDRASEEIRFEPNTISGTYRGSLEVGESYQYRLGAGEGQSFEAAVDSELPLCLATQDGGYTEASLGRLIVLLPKDGEYYLTVFAPDRGGAYTLDVIIE